MSKKRDPLTGVVQYFTTAPVDEALKVLSIVKEIVHSRSPLRAAAKKPASPATAPARGKGLPPITGTLKATLAEGELA